MQMQPFFYSDCIIQMVDAGMTFSADSCLRIDLVCHLPVNHMRYWLMKSEPEEVSIDDVLSMPNQTVAWTGVRNYQARNFMRDAMQVGDGVLFYHSSCAIPGVAGLAEVVSTAYPDDTQFDAGSHYHDPKATRENPRWMLVDVRATRKTRLIPLTELRAHPDLAGMQILQRGNRLSITPVTKEEWDLIVRLARKVQG
jgi:predicted RNA-binding protein with PUA-like domain